MRILWIALAAVSSVAASCALEANEEQTGAEPGTVSQGLGELVLPLTAI